MILLLTPGIGVNLYRSLVLPETSAPRCLAFNSTEGRRLFKVGAPLAREVVFAPRELTSETAQALGLALRTTVSKEDERWTIKRSPEVSRQLTEDDQRWVRDQALEVVKGVRSRVAGYDGSPSSGVLEILRRNRAEFEAGKAGRIDFSSLRAQEASPQSRLLIDLLEGMPVRSWSFARPGEICVFSNRPVPGEHPLEGVAVPLQRYRVSQEALFEWSQKAGAGAFPEADQWLLPQAAPRTGKKTILLSVSRESSRLLFSIQVFDQAGNIESGMSIEPRGPALDPTKTRKTLGLADLSSPTQVALQQFASGSFISSSPLLDPDANDPLGLPLSEPLSHYAKAQGFTGVVACLPDGLLTGVKSCFRGTQVDLDAFRRILAEADCEEIPSGKTLVIRPIRPIQEEALRTDRAPLIALYRRARAGTFGDPDLVALHAAYASEYEKRPLLTGTVAAIRNAFRLSEHPNWDVPHPFLSLLGEMSPSERSSLEAGKPVPLAPSRRLASLDELVRLARSRATDDPGLIMVGGVPVENASRSTALDLQPSRMLADPRGILIGGNPYAGTFVKRVAKGTITRQLMNPNTGEIKTEAVENAVLDPAYQPFAIQSLLGLPLREKAASEMLDRQYRFLWAQESRLSVTANFGNGLRLGPVLLRKRLKESSAAVPLADVPGTLRP